MLSVVDGRFACGCRDALDGLSSDKVKSRVLENYKFVLRKGESCLENGVNP